MASSAALPAAQPAAANESEAEADSRAAAQARPVSANIAMLGAGNMGGAMMQGWLASGVATTDTLAACVRSEESMLTWNGRGVQVFGDIEDGGEAAALAEFADVIVLGVKPHYLGDVLARLAPHLSPRHTVVSIAAGWTMAQLEAALPPGTAVVRVMPNTPVLVSEGACVYALGSHARAEDRALVHRLLDACGLALEVSEDMIDAVIGVAGSAPAYMFQILEAMADGGVRLGLPRDKALALAAQTMKGAAEMVLSPGRGGGGGAGGLSHPGVLKDQVTSPGGTTITALGVLEEEGVRSAFIKAVAAAADKSREMAADR